MKMMIYMLGLVMAPVTGKELLTEVLDRYTGTLELEYSVVKSGNKEAEKCTYYTNGENYYAETPTGVTLLNEKYFVEVDKNTRQIIIAPHKKTGKRENRQPFDLKKDRLAHCKFTVIKGKGYTGIKVSDNKSLVKEVTYEISDKDHVLQKVHYSVKMPYGDKTSSTTVHYTKTDFTPIFKKDFFSEKRFLKKTGKGFETSEGTFKGYTVTDLTQ